jgi:hypothetical protein
VIVKPETVIAWRRKGFRLFWTWKVRRGQAGRPPVSKATRELIRKMSRENPLWGAPRIHGELLKLGIDVGGTSAGKYMVRHRKPSSHTWRTYPDNHVKQLVSADRALQCHCPRDCGMDGPTTTRRGSVGQRAALSAARS